MKYFTKLTLLLMLLIGITIPSVYAQTDSDGDGINDNVDKCPNSVRIDTEPPGPDGCYDKDGDGLTGDDDLCYNSPLPSNSLGCWDEDQDGFAYDPNYVNQISPKDNCPTEYSLTNNGCPDPNAATPTHHPTSTPDTSHTNTSHTATPTATEETGTHVGLPDTSAPATFEACANLSLPSQLEKDKFGTLTTDNNATPLNFRGAPSTDSGVIASVRATEVFQVLDGPRCTASLRWWNVYFEGRSGWIAESSGNAYLARPLTINDEEIPDNAIVIVEDLTQATNDNGGTYYRYEQNPRVTLSPGTKVRVIMSVPNGHTYIYIDILDGTDLLSILQESTNDNSGVAPENLEFEARQPANDDPSLHSVYGESDADGKIFIIIVPPTNEGSTGRGSGGQDSNTSATGRGGDDSSSSSSSATGRGSESSSNSSSAAAAAAAARNNTSTCNNVAVEIDIYGNSFFSPNGELLDSNEDTGWNTRVVEDAWFGVALDGTQSISSIEFNSYSWTDTVGNSVKDFDVTYYDLASGEFVEILLGTASQESGYQTYTFDRSVTVDNIVIFIVNNHGGTAYEVADIRVCAE